MTENCARRTARWIVGNWKMHGLSADLAEIDAMAKAAPAEGAQLAVCPPTTLIGRAVECAAGSNLMIGGQDCHVLAAGACTGEIAAEMLADLGARLVIVGHSERRAENQETDAVVAAKAAAALRAGLTPIICIGESRAEREAGRTLDVLAAQLDASVPDVAGPDAGAPDRRPGCRAIVAYEPLWCIGAGFTPSLADIAAVHTFLAGRLGERFGPAPDGMPILYGGSVTPANAGDILKTACVGGVLVGGASRKAADLLAIAGSAP